MLHYDRIDVSEGIDANKTSASKRVWCLSLLVYLKLYLIRFQPKVCNRCHNLLMMSVNLSDIAILNIKCSDYCYLI